MFRIHHPGFSIPMIEKVAASSAQVFVWLLVLSLWPLAAAALELDGKPIQGGLLIGHVMPGSRASLDGEAVRVSGDGRFLLGFDRDAGPVAELKVERPDGETLTWRLRIRQREYDIQRIDGLPERKVTPSEQDLERIRRESELIDAARTAARRTEALYIDGEFRWPVTGRISGVYGSQRILNGKPRRPHYGLDIAADKGTPVRSPAAGVVAFTHPDMYFNGATVVLDHGHGLTSTYIHLSRIEVEPGEWVDRGQAIGAVGASGRATGPHLHWGMQWFDRHIDPRLLVGQMP